MWNLQLQQEELERLERRLARQPVNLAVLTAHALDGMRATMQERGVTLYSQIDQIDGSVSGVRARWPMWFCKSAIGRCTPRRRAGASSCG